MTTVTLLRMFSHSISAQRETQGGHRALSVLRSALPLSNLICINAVSFPHLRINKAATCDVVCSNHENKTSAHVKYANSDAALFQCERCQQEQGVGAFWNDKAKKLLQFQL